MVEVDLREAEPDDLPDTISRRENLHRPKGWLRPINSFVRQLASRFRRHGAYLWLLLILGLAVYFGLNQKVEIFSIWDTIFGADRRWLLALIGLEVVILILVAGTYRSLLGKLGHHIKVDTLVGVHLKRVVVGTITPVGGPASMLVFVHALRNRGVRPVDALLAVSIKSVIGNIAFLILLLPVLFVQEPSPLLISGAAGLVLLVAIMAAILGLALRSTKPPQWFLSRLPRKGLKLLAQVRLHDISVPRLAGPFALMMATKLAGVLMLFFSLRAVGHNTDIAVPLIAYVVGMVFLLVAPVFNGIGFVEVSMAVALQQLGVPPAAAIGATLLTRAGELWLPLAAGIAFQAFETLSSRFGSSPPAAIPALRPVPVTNKLTPSFKTNGIRTPTI
ncbi:MAG: lysylphosphatidylglycerol synthase transmembrane domain-containing protein [Thermomicrobiales bacterium]